MPILSRQDNNDLRYIPGDFASNVKWLETHYREYDGRYVVLHMGELLVSGDTFNDIHPFVIQHPNHNSLLWVHVGREFRIM